MIDNAPGVADHSIAASSAYSPAGVRYFDGQINVASTELSSDGFSGLWNQTLELEQRYSAQQRQRHRHHRLGSALSAAAQRR